MKKSAEEAETGADYSEVLKAAAQAWHAQSGNPTPTSGELGAAGSTAGSSARRPRRPCSRFKLEAMRSAADRNAVVAFYPNSSGGGGTWDFAQSLWDSYEIVAIAKKLDAGLALDADADGRPTPPGRAAVSGRSGKRSRESKNSLRSMFHRVSDSKSRAVDPGD